MANNTIIQRNTIVDCSTGEVIKDTQEVTKVGQKESEPAFVKLYLNDIAKLYDLAPYEYNILMCLFKIAEYNTGLLELTPHRKRTEIIEPLGIKTQTLKNALTSLKSKGIIFSVERGTYRFNPNVIFKGDWTSNRELRLTITYDEKGREIKLESKKDHSEIESE